MLGPSRTEVQSCQYAVVALGPIFCICPRPGGAVIGTVREMASVRFQDLQEMQNHMRETIDGGLDQLQAKAGQGGLPAAPPGANAPPVQSAFAPIAPPPDPNVASEPQAAGGRCGSHGTAGDERGQSPGGTSRTGPGRSAQANRYPKSCGAP